MSQIAAGRAVAPPPSGHFGVYARIVHDGALLCVRKTRGPYQGLLDLPGGSPNPAESLDAALARELAEELGVADFTAGQFRPFAFHVSESSSGVPIDFSHRGMVADVRLLEALPADVPNSSDTAGWQWRDLGIENTSDLSALARIVGLSF